MGRYNKYLRRRSVNLSAAVRDKSGNIYVSGGGGGGSQSSFVRAPTLFSLPPPPPQSSFVRAPSLFSLRKSIVLSVKDFVKERLEMRLSENQFYLNSIF